MPVIIRNPARTRYTIIANRPIEDCDLSWKARGLLCYLLSKPDGWNVSRDQIVRAGPDGQSSVESALRELEAAGYLVREHGRDENGKFAYASVLYEEPQENPAVDNPTRVNPTGENLTHSNYYRVKTDQQTLYSNNAEPENLPAAIGRPTPSKGTRRASTRDLVFEAVCSACGASLDALTTSFRGQVNKAAKELRDVGATPDDIERAALVFAAEYPTIKLTPTALAKHFPTLGEVRTKTKGQANFARQVADTVSMTSQPSLEDQVGLLGDDNE